MTAPAALSAQTPPPVRGTMATEGNRKTFYRAANTVIVTTIDGAEHVYHFTKDLIVHGGKGLGVDALAGLREGSTVVVHYTVNGQTASADEIDVIGDEDLKVTARCHRLLGRSGAQGRPLLQKTFLTCRG